VYDAAGQEFPLMPNSSSPTPTGCAERSPRRVAVVLLVAVVAIPGPGLSW
jgi:hypothetical protein